MAIPRARLTPLARDVGRRNREAIGVRGKLRSAMSSPADELTSSVSPPIASEEPAVSRLRRAGAFVGPLLVIASLLNGMPAFLKRVGAVRADRYDAYWNAYCGPDSVSPRAFGVGRVCAPGPRPQTPGHRDRVNRHFAYVLTVEGREIPAKAFKDAGLAAIVVVGLLLWRSGAQRPSGGWPLVLLSAVLAMAVPWTLLGQGAGPALAGLRCYGFLGVAFVGGYATRDGLLDRIASAVAFLLVLQLLLVPWELVSSMPFMGLGAWPFYLPRRLAAAFVLPSSLGIFAAAALSFCIGSAVYRRHGRVLWATAVLLVVLAASGTGVVALLGLAAVTRLQGRARVPLAVILGLVTAGTLLALLPVTLGRPDLFRSIVGPGSRLEVLHRVLAQPAPTVLFGQGLGSGTNTMGTVTMHLGADSTVILLILQIGVVGAACFYALLAWAGLRDPRLLPFFVITSVCSLTLNVPEAFPLNLLLGLAIAHSASLRQPSSTATGSSAPGNASAAAHRYTSPPAAAER